jgi:hypothetical protein
VGGWRQITASYPIEHTLKQQKNSEGLFVDEIISISDNIQINNKHAYTCDDLSTTFGFITLTV